MAAVQWSVRRRRLRARLFLLLVGFVLGLGSSEIALRTFAPEHLFWPVTNIYRPVETPGVNYTLIPDFAGPAFGVELRTNHLGFRGPEWSPRKPTGTYRIAILGDSHAFGFGVPFERTVGEVTARLLKERGDRHYEVLNFAVPGYNSEQELAVMRGIASTFAPDLVVVVPCNNDDEPALFADPSGYLSAEPPDRAILLGSRWLGSVLVRLRSAIRRLLASSRIFRLVKGVVRSRQARTTTGPTDPSARSGTDPDWMGPISDGPVSPHLTATVEEPLRQIAFEARRNGAEVLIASFAAPSEYRRVFQKLSREEDIPLVELLGLFPEVHDWNELLLRFGLGWDPHLGAEAHARWARAIVDRIAARGFLDQVGRV
jgi:lysophospholipase L1-like esterase